MNQRLQILQHLEGKRPEEALALLATEEGDPQDPFRAYLLAWAALLQEQWDDVFRHLDPLLPPSQQTPWPNEAQLKQPTRLALSWFRLGRAALSLDEVEQAYRHLQQSFALAQPRIIELRPWLLFEVCVLLARVLLAKKNPGEALVHLGYAALNAPPQTDQRSLARMHEDRAEAYRMLGDFTTMELEIREALGYYAQSVGDRARLLLYLGDQDERATSEQQLSLYTDALALADKSGNPSLLLRCYLALARYYRSHGRRSTAATFVHLARPLVTKSSNALDIAFTLLENSRVSVDEAHQSSSKNEAEGWYQQALDLLSQAETVLEQTAFTPLVGEVLTLRVQVLEALGRHKEALATYTRLQSATQHKA